MTNIPLFNLLIIFALIYFLIHVIVLITKDVIIDKREHNRKMELLELLKETLEPSEEPPKQVKQHHTKTKPEPSDLLFVLDYLLQNNIIDNQTYNQLISKAMPFL